MAHSRYISLTTGRSRSAPRAVIIRFSLWSAALAKRPLALPRAGRVPRRASFSPHH